MTEENHGHNHNPDLICDMDCPRYSEFHNHAWLVDCPPDCPRHAPSDFDDLLKYKLIRDMSKEELVAELNESWTKELLKQDIGYLKSQVIQNRLMVVKDRMLREAGMRTEPGFLGFPRLVEDEERVVDDDQD